MRVATVAIVHLLTVRVALAWGYGEHQYLGETSFEAACRRMEDRHRNNTQVIEALELACGPRDANGKPRTRAQLYGQSTAIAADHLSSPDEFLSNTAPELAQSLFKYVGLALENESHFVPSAPRNWRDYHTRSVQIAMLSRQKRLNGLLLQKEFERAFYTHAFADHFLQDSFSAGHSGFARVASRPSVAGAMHDKFNEIGRRLKDGRGETWYAFGDGKLRDVRNEANLRRVLAAAEHSVTLFLTAFVTARADHRGELDIYARFPIAASGFDDCKQLRPHDVDAIECNDAMPLSVSIQQGARVDVSTKLEFVSIADRWKPTTNLSGAALAFRAGPTRFVLGFYVGLTKVDGADHATLGAATGFDVPLYAKFPLPMAFEAAVRLMYAGTNTDESSDHPGHSRLTALASLRVSLDVGKAWAFALAPSVCYSWASTSEWDGVAPCVMVTLERVISVSGGGHK